MRLIVVLTLLLLITTPHVVSSQVAVVRSGDENPVLTIAKSTFWGGVTGLVLGGATALVVDDNKDDVVKWFFVGGTFGGFGFGVYHVLNRPGPSSALLQIDRRGLAFSLPNLEMTRSLDGTLETRVALLSYRF